MGACTSSVKRRHKEHRQLHKQAALKNAIVLDNKQLSPLPLTVFSSQPPHSDHQISPRIETNSLIQLYSTNTNNNNSNISPCMSSSSHIPPRIPVTKSRLPIHQSQSSATGLIKPRNIPVLVGTTNPTSNILVLL